MIDFSQAALLGTVAASFLGEIIVIAFTNHPNVRETSSFIVGFATFLLATFNIPSVFRSQPAAVARDMQTGVLSINGAFMFIALIIVLLAVDFWGV